MRLVGLLECDMAQDDFASLFSAAASRPPLSPSHARTAASPHSNVLFAASPRSATSPLPDAGAPLFTAAVLQLRPAAGPGSLAYRIASLARAVAQRACGGKRQGAGLTSGPALFAYEAVLKYVVGLTALMRETVWYALVLLRRSV
jgi:hypothetical protein